MRLTTKGRFAVTAMIDLGLRQSGGPVTLAAISQRQQISLSYLEQLFGKLRRHELVESTRGPGGGYTLARKAADITVADIIVSVDEPIDATQCGGKENCLGEGSRCMTHDLWASLNVRMVEFLDSVTLQKLVDDQLAKGLQVEDKPSVKLLSLRCRCPSPSASTLPTQCLRWAMPSPRAEQPPNADKQSLFYP
jgi:Rrf2 family transcriptional regulator, iron-sulfur cluster assembly transcription factor